MNQQHQSIHGVPEGASLYFIGIGGISMSGLAEIALSNDFIVNGSDFHSSDHVQHLKEIGINVFIGHDTVNIDAVKPDFVIYTAAIPKDNVELLYARKLGIPTIDRAEFLGWLTESFNSVINISGTHGKTTTTALTSLLLIASNADPTVHLGAQFKAFNRSTIRLGEPGKLLVSEACEYNNSFLHFTSTTAVILNIDEDHLDFFGDLDHIIDSFVAFAARLNDQHTLILPCADPNVRNFLKRLQDRTAEKQAVMPQIVWFGTAEEFSASACLNGFEDSPRFVAENIYFEKGFPRFELILPSLHTLHIKLSVPGFHNVHDTLAAIAAAYYNGLDPAIAPQVLKDFTGAEGRFTINGLYKGAVVVSDYAHHPNAARATLAAAKNIPHNHTYVVFQPLTFVRVKLLFDDFVACLYDNRPDLVIFYEIFSDRETDDLGMSSRLLSEAYNAKGLPSIFVNAYDTMLEQLKNIVKEGDMVLFLGPEEVRNLGKRLVTEQD